MKVLSILMNSSMTNVFRFLKIKVKIFVFILCLFVFTSFVSSQVILHEVFNDINQLPASGWVEINMSTPVGSSGYFQGLPSIFPSYSGAPSSYMAVNYNSTSGTGTISNWKITPQLTLKTGDVIKFRTRTSSGSQFPDRLQLRLNVLGTTNVGTTATSVGNFTVLLTDINSSLTLGGYPETWTEYTATVSGLSNPTVCRLAFRYFVTNGGPNGVNSNYVGIDEFIVYRPVTPFACANGVGCQAPDQATAYYSSTNSGFSISEQFVPTTSGPITEICWFGLYFNPSLTIDCSPGPGDEFFITYYSDNNGEPGDTFAGPYQANVTKALTGNLLLGFISEFGFGATHPPVYVIANQSYWLSIRNNIVSGDCRWGWVTSDQGDSIHFLNGAVQQNDDLAFCLNVPILPDGGLSAAPFNDVCINAIHLTCDTVVTGTTINATVQNPPDSCFTNVSAAQGVWYKLTGNGQNIIFSTCNVSTDFNTRLAVYSGSCNNLTCIAGNDNAGSQTCILNPSLSEIVFCSENGVDYYIYVTGSPGAFGNFNLSVQCDIPSPPQITNCLPDVTVFTDQGLCEANVSIPLFLNGVNYTYDCYANSINSYNQTTDASGFYPVGTTVITWKISDVFNQIDSCFQTVTVIDNQSPLVTCPPNITVPVDVDSCIATTVSLGTPIVSDNCSILNISNNAPLTFNKGLTEVLWTAYDIHNNVATCTQSVQVIDDQLPSIMCPQDIIVSADSGFCYATILNLGQPLTSDNCLVDTMFNDAPAIFNIGSNVVIWRVYDLDDNYANCAQNVLVIDNEAPVIICPSDSVIPADPGQCSVASVQFNLPNVSDNCMVTNLIHDAVFPLQYGLTEILWTASDASGNTSGCIQILQVIDIEAPVIICPDDLIVEADYGTNHATGVALGSPQVSDNCGIFGIVSDAQEPFQLGNTVVTWTVSDNDGNATDCIQIVIVTPFVGYNTEDALNDLFLIIPNPLSRFAEIRFVLNERTYTSLYITDVTGKVIAEFFKNVIFEPGSYSENFNSEAAGIMSGVYFVILNRDGHIAVRKMMVSN
jgi:hypothetical protein